MKKELDDDFNPIQPISKWPTDREAYQWLPNIMDACPRIDMREHRKVEAFYKTAMGKAFRFRVPTVLEYEQRMCSTRIKNASGEKETKTWPRWYVLVELDEYVRPPAYVPTRWERFKAWVTRTPIAQPELPPRIQQYWSMSDMQFKLFRQAFANEEFV